MLVVFRSPGSTAVMGPGVIDVWPFRLDAADDLADALTGEERARAGRFRLDRVRKQFVAGRGMLRTVLGRYLGCPAGEVPLTFEAGGKPVLDTAAPSDLQFNLSHSGSFGLLAVARRPVGIDLEELREVPDAGDLIVRFFSDAERNQFEQLPVDLRLAGFFRGWTCKEALLKAVGRGLGDLDSCVVDLDPRVDPRIVRFDPGEWRVATWEPWTGYAAAVAVESTEPIRFG